jgi:4-hydroxybenzoate polyprenyltransferase
MKSIVELMRPSHWSKNVFVFAALIFGRRLLGSFDDVVLSVLSACAAFFCFSLASSAVYIFNDIIDREADRVHPEKRKRPIAAGKVTIGPASVLAAVCAVIALVCSYALVRELAYIIGAYIVLMVLYSVLFKRLLILDVITISIGFVLRAAAGAVVVGVFISPWLIICTFALCLFLGFGKRRSELATLAEDSESFRKTLGGYTPELLGHMLDVTSVLAIVCFLIYSMDDRTVAFFGTKALVFTVPLVLYCVFRFSLLVQKGLYSGPVEITLRDLPFQVGFVLWILCCMFLVYAHRLGFDLFNVLAY